MEWFRFYHEALDDLKVQQLKPESFKHWVNLLCLANLSKPRGTLPDLPTIAFRLRISESDAGAIVDDFIHRGLIDFDAGTYFPHNWEGRQKRSDSSAERVAKHRSNAHVTPSNDDVTLPKRYGNVLDTDTDTDTEKSTPPVVPLKGEPKPKPARTIKTPVPDNLASHVPDSAWDAMESEQGMTYQELAAETIKMIDHFRAKGERKADWVAAWRNWMRSDFRKPRGSPAANGREDATITADRDKLLADQLANDPQAYLSWGKR